MSAAIRPATGGDAAAVADVYNWYVRHTVVSFEEEPVSAEEMQRRIESISTEYDWLVLERDDAVLGYAYAGPFRPRPAYRSSAESTIYLRHGLEGQGLGRGLYRELIDRTLARGFRTLIGGIALPNEASTRLHEKLGFEKVGHLRAVGRKFDRWIDVGYWQLEAGPRTPGS
jgi:phosphinothricin acetyltransferase